MHLARIPLHGESSHGVLQLNQSGWGRLPHSHQWLARQRGAGPRRRHFPALLPVSG
nr:Hypothetical protein [Aeromonas caviae]